jgi:hypothetical protein
LGATVMRISTLPVLREFAGLAGALWLFAVSLGIIDVVRFRPGGESSTPFEAFTLTFVIWGVLVTLGTGAGFVSVIGVAALFGIRSPWPAGSGVLSAAFVVVAAGFGLRSAKGPLGLVLLGAIAGLAVVVLALPTRRGNVAPN